jgi:glucoamylase
MTGNDDTGAAAGGSLLSADGTNASAVVTSPALGKTSSGYLGTSDGWTDLATDHAMDWSYDATALRQRRADRPGQGERLRNHQTSPSRSASAPPRAPALSTAQASLGGGFAAARTAYDAGWAGYLGSFKPVPASASGWSTEWKVSAMVLAASEDKTVRGGFVADPTGPGPGRTRCSSWPSTTRSGQRDLYQIATGLLAVGDDAAANRALDFLWNVQQRADGSFPQNSRLDGTPVFGDLQMDEVAFPIVLAHQLGRTGAADWAHVKKSADYVVAHGRGRRRSGGRTRLATRPRPSRPRSPAWSARPTSRPKNDDSASAGPTSPRPTSGSRPSSR